MINKILLKSTQLKFKGRDEKRVNSWLALIGQGKYFRASCRIWRNNLNSGELLSWTSGFKWHIKCLISSICICFPDAFQIFDVDLHDILKIKLSLYKNKWSSAKWIKTYSIWQVTVCQNYSLCKEERSFWLVIFKFWCLLCFFMYLTIFSVEAFFLGGVGGWRGRNFDCCCSEKEGKYYCNKNPCKCKNYPSFEARSVLCIQFSLSFFLIFFFFFLQPHEFEFSGSCSISGKEAKALNPEDFAIWKNHLPSSSN